MIEKLGQSSGSVVGFKMSGKLHDEDYRQFVPLLEKTIKEHGKARLLAQFQDFHSWNLHALWGDIKFSTRHCTDVAQVALVGEKKWGQANAVPGFGYRPGLGDDC